MTNRKMVNIVTLRRCFREENKKKKGSASLNTFTRPCAKKVHILFFLALQICGMPNLFQSPFFFCFLNDATDPAIIQTCPRFLKKKK